MKVSCFLRLELNGSLGELLDRFPFFDGHGAAIYGNLERDIPPS
jgi:hypothetical protein